MIARRGIGALTGLLLAARPGLSQPAFPMRPPRLIVPFTPGGAPDLVARTLAEESGRRWPHAVVVESRPGAGGNIAAEAVARAAPDGHTLLLMSNNIVAVNPHIGRMAIDPLTDLAPVALLARSPLVFVVGADSPVRDIGGLVAQARAAPRALAYASAGNGSPHHLAMALLCQRAGVEMTHVPYRGTIAGLTDLMGGRVAAMASPFGTARPLIEEGKLRPVAAAAITRLPWLPDLPTVAESGLPGFDANTWLALAAPRGTPAPIIGALADFAVATMDNPRVREALDRGGNEVRTAPPETLGALWRSDHAEWGAVIREARITAD
ncbi:Bug family tripartite tricarboxylate transporter substrate binding protein [Muricoccus aerilatus]|uniref:Bug family tripartite tricarboxylate transporter substrate binding protein n=1 Tax=Muricoccus aerilatus TaxID=452982 RepID=UPI0005C15155|nr:tripartite tricarboxylate transporter substrate binding protein [Roseomonas aerilata]